jgi:hypothetical protein
MTTPAPGLYAGVPETTYHGDRGSLSSSGARRLLEVAPAQWKWERDHPKEPTADMILGSAVHTLTLGVGAPVVEVKVDTWQSGAAKARRAEIESEGGIALKTKDYEQAVAMATAARAEIDALVGEDHIRYPELSGYAEDPETGVMLRMRADLLVQRPDGTWYVIDLKTTAAVNPQKFDKSVAEYGYHQQDPWYRDVLALRPMCVHVDTFLFLAISKDPPYLASTAELDPFDVDLGRRLNRRAIDLYAKCAAADDWPAHPHHIVSLPSWAAYREASL